MKKIYTLAFLMFNCLALAESKNNYIVYNSLGNLGKSLIFILPSKQIGIGGVTTSYDSCSEKELCIHLEDLLITFPKQDEPLRFAGLVANVSSNTDLMFMGQKIPVSVVEIKGSVIEQTYYYSEGIGLVAFTLKNKNDGSNSFFLLSGKQGLTRSDVFIPPEGIH